MLRHRRVVLAAWAAVLVAGVAAAVALPGRLATSFAVPGTGSQRAQTLLERHFGERPDGTFTVVFRVAHPSDGALQRRLRARARPRSRAPCRRAGSRAAAPGRADPLRRGRDDARPPAREGVDGAAAAGAARGGRPARARHRPAGAPARPRPGARLRPAARRGDRAARRRSPSSLLVLGLSLAALVPFVVGACTIAGTLGVVWAIAHARDARLVRPEPRRAASGIGLAVDYSLLVVSRFREELVRDGRRRGRRRPHGGDGAGGAVLVSGVAVAIGLALLLRRAGAVRPLARARRARRPARLDRRRRDAPAGAARDARPARRPRPAGRAETRFWERLARSAIMRRPRSYPRRRRGRARRRRRPGGVPAADARLLHGPAPPGRRRSRAPALLRAGAGAGALTPIEVVVDGGAPGAARSRRRSTPRSSASPTRPSATRRRT